MRSLCRNCAKFGTCGFGAAVEMQMICCRSYVRGSVNHNQDVFVIGETKRGRPRKNEAVAQPTEKKVADPDKVEKRVRKILADWPWEFHAKELKQEYQKQYGEKLVMTSTLRNAVCTPWKYGILVNKVKVKRRKNKTA